MSGRLRMPGGMAIRRVIATMRAAAFLAGAQVNPFTADLHAFITLVSLSVFHCGNHTNVRAALIRH
jgi:hypothetical protein